MVPTQNLLVKHDYDVEKSCFLAISSGKVAIHCQERSQLADRLLWSSLQLNLCGVLWNESLSQRRSQT